MDNEPKGKAKKLARELQKLLEENLPKDPGLTNEAMARARAIREEIQQMGIRVTWEAVVNPETLAIKVDVTLWQPRKNLSPEEQKAYDAWFA